jgi:3D (Asp-Asp-Asp) domain-containing protein
MFGRTLAISGLFMLGIFFFMNEPKVVLNSVSNVDSARSIEAYHMISRYDNREKKLVVRAVSNMNEAALYGPNTPISFIGQMTAYKATCVGCTGIVACPPRQDVRGDNIWFYDGTYGKIRILAADPHIPCGTIMQATNLTFSNEPVIGIVLDRGGAIKGNITDFLVGPEEDMDMVGRQRGVNYEVLRWGW